MSVYCTFLIWGVAVDWFFQLFVLYLSRRDETEADLYAVKRGYGKALKSGLIRNFGHNLDNFFNSPFTTFVFYTHPTLLQRIADINIA